MEGARLMNADVRTVALIPARGGSKGIPLKNIKPLGGRPLIHWTLEAACLSEVIQEVFVATDDERIAAVVAELGHPKVRVISRSPETATDTASTESVLLEFARDHEFEHLVLIQATSPLLAAGDLDDGLRRYFEGRADSMLSVVRQKRFLWEAEAGGTARPLNYVPASRPRRQDFDGFLVENGAFYVTRREALLTSGCRLSGRVMCHEMAEETYVELDEPADWDAVGAMLAHRSPPAGRPMDRIKLVLTDVDGVLTDGGMYYGSEGDTLKRFNTRDGMGMELLRNRGILTGIITREQTGIVSQRAKKLQVDILIQGCRDKLPAFQQILAERNLKASEVAYIGDDLNDVEVLAHVGFSAAPADAADEAKNSAHYICTRKGGEGCFREFAEVILRRQANFPS